MAALGTLPAIDPLGEAMKVSEQYLQYVLSSVVAEENQKLLLKIEELIMSKFTPTLQTILTKVIDLKNNADALSASMVEKDQELATVKAALDEANQKLANANAQVTDAAANAVDDNDVQTINDITAVLG